MKKGGLPIKSVDLSQYKNLEKIESKNRLGKEIKPLYYKDNRDLFPVLKKKFDARAAKFIALKSIEESIRKTKKVTFIEKFAKNTAIISLLLLSVSTIFFGRQDMTNLVPSYFFNTINGEISRISNINHNNNQLASSIFSGGGWQSISGWIKNTAYEIVKPWLSISPHLAKNNTPQPSLTLREGEEVARTVFVPVQIEII